MIGLIDKISNFLLPLLCVIFPRIIMFHDLKSKNLSLNF